MLAAFGTRALWLPDFPPGLNFDEGFYGLDALSVLQGNILPFYPLNGGRESLFMVLVAPFILIFGRDPLALRTVTAGIGVLTIAVTYPLGKRLFRSSIPEAAEWIGLATFAVSAGSLWFILYNRIGLRINVFPFAMAVAGYWFWRAYEQRSNWTWVMAGLGFGMVQYTYTAARVVPAIIPGFIAARAVVDLSLRDLWARRREWAVFALVAVLAISPLAIYGLTHQEDFFRRQAAISPLNEAKNPEPPAVRIGKSLIATMPMFFVEGDLRIYRNLPGKPVFDAWLAPFFLIGLGLAIKRVRTPANLFILLWFGILVAASAVPLGVVPHNSHAIGLLPIVYVFPALGLVETVLWAARRKVPIRATASVAAALVLLTAVVSIKQYFVDWRALDSGFQFDSDVAEIANTMNDSGNQPDLAYIIEISRLYPPSYIHGTIDFLYTGSAPFNYLRVDEEGVAANLAKDVGAKRRVIKFERSIERDVPADNQEIVDFLLRRQGSKLDEVPRNGYRYTSYRVDEPLWPSLAPGGWRPASAAPVDGVRLNRSAAGISSSADTVWAIADWTAGKRDADIKASIRLKDASGRQVSLADRDLLAPPFFDTASRWEGEQNVLTYHLLKLPPGLIPGDYRLSAVLYEAETGKQLGVGGQELELGIVSVPGRKIDPAELDPEVLLSTPIEQRRSGGVSLLGREIANDDLKPGQPIEVTTLWQADQAAPVPGPVTIRAVDKSGVIAGSWTGDITRGAYPSTRWPAGSIVRDTVAIELSTVAQSGTYVVDVSWNGLRPVPIGEVDITARQRIFAVPQLGAPVDIPAGDFARLVRWDGAIDAAGRNANIRLVWQSVAPTTRNWTVFVHIVDSAGRIVGQSDHVPLNGEAPTSSWAQGEVIQDVHQVALTAPGRYLVQVGMYDPKTNERVLLGSRDSADLGQIG